MVVEFVCYCYLKQLNLFLIEVVCFTWNDRVLVGHETHEYKSVFSSRKLEFWATVALSFLFGN